MSVSDNPPRPPGRPGPSEQVRAFDQMYDGGRHRGTSDDRSRHSSS
jgi:hypothetical protein